MFGRKPEEKDLDFRPMIQRLTEDLTVSELEFRVEKTVRSVAHLEKRLLETEKDLAQANVPGKMISEKYDTYFKAWEDAISRADMFLAALNKKKLEENLPKTD